MAFNASNDQIRNDIDRFVNGRNAARNREILKRRLIDGITFDRLAEEFGLSVPQTKLIIAKTSDQLFRNVRY